MNARETAWRLFASEFNSCTFDKKSTDDKMPSYVISPLGNMINRVMVAGILLDKENTGTEEEPMWKARINDVSGNTYIQVGRFQPEAMGEIANIPSPAFVVAIGKAKTFTFGDDGRVRVSLRPERILEVDESVVNLWTLEAAQSMWSRLLRMKEALEIPDVSVDQLKAKGFTQTEAEGITAALDAYGFPQSQNYLKTIQAALKRLLPNSSIDFGLPENVSDLPDEIDMPGKDEKKSDNPADAADREDTILRIIEELSGDPKGAPRDEVDRMAAMEGISANDVEEITTALMDKGLIYEPNLGYLKVI